MVKFTLSLEDDEIAVPIEGYEGRYVVTSLGRVFSMLSGKFLKGFPDSDGYLQVGLYNTEHSEKTIKIHKLVAKTFIPNPENKPTVNHKNHKRWDNRVENLEWYTESEQQDETCRENIKLALRNSTTSMRSRSVVKIETCEFYWSQSEATQSIGHSRGGSGAISKCCRGLQPTAYGYHWRYATEEEIAQHS